VGNLGLLVLMDTNACVYVIKEHVGLEDALERLFEEKVELAVLNECLLESKRLGFLEERAFGRFIEAFKPKIVEGGRRNVDGAVLAYAMKTGCVVCTGDIALRKKLKAKGIRVIVFKKGGSLEVT